MSAAPGGTDHRARRPWAASSRRFVYLAATLAMTEFKLRFFGSALGYFWQLVRPLMLFGVLYFVFTKFVKIGGAVEPLPRACCWPTSCSTRSSPRARAR